jgi:hypothetical protein
MGGLMSGCGKKMTEDETSKLEESKKAAEAAVKKLHKLRIKKAKLEAEKNADGE